AFLSRLEDEIDSAIEVSGLREIVRRAQQNGRVPVVSAGVHPPIMARAMRELVFFVERQRIHVGAQTDRAVAGPRLESAHEARRRDAARDLDAEGFQALGNEIRGALLLEAEFRMGMEVPAPLRQLVLLRDNLGNDWHGRPRTKSWRRLRA